MTYTCSIVGGGNTVWNGSAFDCPSSSESFNNQILLRHSGFGSRDNSMGSCNDGTIVAEGVSAEDDYFTSQLSVVVGPSIVGRQVTCYYENTVSEVVIGNATIMLTTGGRTS